ncbi:hypothetical protein ACIBO5_58620 [Nonomuraea angiospora]
MTQLPLGCAVVPSTRTCLVACSMTARMYWRCPFRVMVSMKSCFPLAQVAEAHQALEGRDVHGKIILTAF